MVITEASLVYRAAVGNGTVSIGSRNLGLNYIFREIFKVIVLTLAATLAKLFINKVLLL
jgi:hydrogenase maturation factor HypE